MKRNPSPKSQMMRAGERDGSISVPWLTVSTSCPGGLGLKPRCTPKTRMETSLQNYPPPDSSTGERAQWNCRQTRFPLQWSLNQYSIQHHQRPFSPRHDHHRQTPAKLPHSLPLHPPTLCRRTREIPTAVAWAAQASTLLTYLPTHHES